MSISSGRFGRRGIGVVLAVAAAIRIVYLLDYRAHSIFWDSMLLDAEIYDQWALSILQGDWIGGDGVFSLPPLYPYFLAAIYALLGHSYVAVYVIQSLMGLINIWLIHGIGRKVFDEATALIASVIAVLYGSLMFTDSKLMSTTLALTLGLVLMRVLLLAAERQTLLLWSCCGALVGVTALARPEILLFVPFAVWWIRDVCRRRDTRKSKVVIDQVALAGRQPWFAVSVFLVFTVIAVSPVTLRNWIVSGDWSLSNLVSSQAGITFFQSNNERANGLYTFPTWLGFTGNPKTQAREEEAIAEKETGRDMKRSEVTRYWFRRGLRWILSDPGGFIVLESKKLLRFLGSYEYSTEYIINVERESVKSLWITFLPFAAVTGLAISGVLIQLKRGMTPPAALLLLFVASNFLVVMIFYVSSRYRMPSAPYLILFAAYAVRQIVDRSRSPVSSRRTEAVLYGVIALVLFGIFHLQLDSSAMVQEGNVHYNAGNKYYNNERFEEAVVEYRRALRVDGRNWRAWFNMGNTYNQLGRSQDAIDSYRKALEYNENLSPARQMILRLGGTP